MEFEFAKDFEEHQEKHLQWWLSLTPEQRWKSNWEQVRFLSKAIDGYLSYDTDNYILR